MFESSLRKPDGYARLSSPDGTVERDTLRCVHCGYVWEFVKGSGRKRGFCLKCMGVTCGHPNCDPCIPMEARLDHMEGKTTPYTPLILETFGKGF